MEKLLQGDISPKGLSPLPLAFVGDGVYELLVREYLAAQGNCPVKKLHARKVELVRCRPRPRLWRKFGPSSRRRSGRWPSGAATPMWATSPKTRLWQITTGPQRWRHCFVTSTFPGI